MTQDVTKPLHVIITHEPFVGEPFNAIFQLDYVGQSDELDHHEALKWFKDHGADEIKSNVALNEAANFGSAEVVILKPRFPKVETSASAPVI